MDAIFKRNLRIRDTHVRDNLAPLLARGDPGTVKLDLVLRSLAAEQADPDGAVAAPVHWEHLHDWCRAGYSRNDVRLKQKWVSEKVGNLVSLGLLRREVRPGGRSRLFVLRDLLDRSPIDDPGASSDGYLTVLGDLIAYGHLALWSTAELSAYFAAMMGERYARPRDEEQRHGPSAGIGGGAWFRSLRWFASPIGSDSVTRVLLPFSTRTLRRGFYSLDEQGFVGRRRVDKNPLTGQSFVAITRVIYYNGFDRAADEPAVRKRRLTLRASAPLPEWAAEEISA